MSQKPARVSRLVLGLFLGITALCVAQISWWIYFHLEQTQATLDATLLRWEQDRHRAALEVAEAQGQFSPQEVLAQRYPHLVWRPEASTALVNPEASIAVNQQALAELLAQRRRRMVMLISEGAFFLGLLLVGVLLIKRTLWREVQLKQQQSNFVSAVTHELKSPLAALRLYIETLQLGRVPPEHQGEHLASMLQDVDRLENLVGNLLATARLEEGRPQLHLERTDLVQSVRQYVSELSQRLAERGAQLQLDLPAEPLPVHVDPSAIRLVVRNLLDNAVKYSPGQVKPVTLRLRPAGTQAVLEVEDQGIGLAKEEQERIFGRFYRVGNELVRSVEGAGLGLFLAQALVQAQGGQVEVASPGVNRGATFRVILPLAAETL